jgi:regulator of protease activity HflC (stomatin/prohibitin superfamily)
MELRIAKKVVAGLVIFILFMGSWFIVNPGVVAVTFSRLSGSTATCNQGMHLKMPIFTGVQKFDVRTMRVDIPSESASKDLQKVDVDVVLNYHLISDKVNELYVKVGSDYADKIINPAVLEAVKAATAQFPVEEIIVKREDLRKIIEQSLNTRLASYNIFLESVNLTDIKFDPEFNKVVESKQIEEQKIKTAQYQRMQAEEKKKQTILEAEANAESQRLMRQNVTKDIIALKWIEKWNGTLPTTVIGDKSVPMIQIHGNPEEK